MDPGGLLGLVPAAGVAWVAVRRTRSEPRRLSNAWWLLAALVLVLGAVVSVGAPGGTLLLVLLGLLLVLSPLLVLALLVFLLLNGVVMLRREGRSPGNLLSLLAGIGLLGLCLSPLLVWATDQPVVLAGVLLAVLASGYVGFLFVGYLAYTWLYPRLVRSRPAAWVAVLGSGLGQGGRVTPLLAARIRTGIAQARQRRAEVLVMSGGQGEDEPLPEAEAMGRWALTEGGLDPTAAGGPELALETRARSTAENLRFTVELLRGRAALSGPAPAGPAPTGPVGAGAVEADTIGAGAGEAGSIASSGRPGAALAEGLLVTSSYHVLRTAVLARRLGVPAQAVGAPTAGYFWPSAVLREFVAVLAERRWLHLLLLLLVALPLPALLLVLEIR